MTVTESKRDFNEDGTPFYKKHKIYLYKEDFAKFKEALEEVSDYIIKEKGDEVITSTEVKKNENTLEIKKEDLGIKKEIKTKLINEIKDEVSSDFTEVNFDDLGKD